jgi:ankyrin repeat protein
LLSGRHIQAAIWILLVLAVDAMSQVPQPDESLQREWLDVQAGEGRRARSHWWRDLAPDKLRAYIRADAEVNVSDARGWTPLHSAARYNSDPDVLRALLDAGALIDATDRAGDTPLHWAAADNANVEVVDALIGAGADVHARDRFGWLPIHTAADRNPNPEVMDALLAAGAHRDARAYFVLFRPLFLLKHNSNMSEADKKIALELLQETD